MNHRAEGDKLEKIVLKDLLQYGFSRTANSGARMNNGDLANREWIVECKLNRSTNYAFPAGAVRKLKDQAKRLWKHWALILENKKSEKVVLLSYDTFLTLLDLAEPADGQENRPNPGKA